MRRSVAPLTAVAILAAAVGVYAATRGGGSSPPPPPVSTAAAPTATTSNPPPAAPGASAGDWPLFGYDAARSNANPHPTGVTAADLAGLRRRVVALPGTVDSSPIFLRGVAVDGRRRDAFFMTTTYGRTIALSPAGRVLWTFTPTSYATYAGTAQITTATPAADPDRRYIYSASPDGMIHKLAVASGREVSAAGWPVRVTLLPAREKIASALNVWRDSVIVTTGGYIGDAPPYQGHVVAIRRASGRIAAVFNSLCSDTRRLLDPAACPQSDSAIWGRAGAVVEPATGAILVATGNAPFDGRTAWGDSVLRLAPGALSLRASYTPANQAELNASDLDLGSSAPALVAGRGLLVVQGGKDGVLRLVALAGRSPGRLGGELQRLPTPGGAALFTAIAVSGRAGTERVFVADGSGTAAYRVRGAGTAARLVADWSNASAGTSPVLAGGLLYVYDPGGALNVYDPGTGRRLRSLPAGAGHWSSPIVAGGVIALPAGDANDHSTTGTIDLYAR
ncbi:MAG TPA: hypothetical protein VGI72_09080 [Gaiellales bacterium]